MNGYLGAMGRYARFRGRASRAEFWSFTGMAAVVVFAALFVDVNYISGPTSQSQPFAGLVVLLHILPSWAVSVRRLHDTDRSGWLLLIGVIPLLGTFLLIFWACQAGTSGANRFGPDPHGGDRLAPDAMTAARPARRDVIAEVERLARLKASGSLSEAEFEVLKAETLGRG